MRGKDINAYLGETLKVTNNWTAECEQRGTTISTSAWTATGGLTPSMEALDGSVATAFIAVAGCGCIKNTVTLANGEVLVLLREVKA